MRLSFPPLKWLARAGACALLAAVAAGAQSGPARRLVFSSLPGIVYTSGGLGTVTVQVQDSTGAAVASSSATVQLSASGPHGFSAHLSAFASAGVASLDTSAWQWAAGTYSLTASSPGLAPAATNVLVLPAAVVLPPTSVGHTSAVTQVKVGFTSAATVSSVQVLLQGAPNRDFLAASGGTCAGNQIAGGTCTVPVQFQPSALGPRLGAVVLKGAGGLALQTIYLSGIGQGAGINFSPHSQASIGNFASQPDALAFDGAGNLYVADYDADGGGGNVIRIPVDAHGVLNSAAQSVLPQDLENVDGLAIDGAGNLYAADFDDSELLEVPAGGGPAVVLLSNAGNNNPTAVYNPAGLAVDAAGNLFVCDWGNNRILEIPNQNGKLNPAAVTALGQGLSAPSGIAVDPAGNLLVADWGNGRIVSIPLQNGAYNSAAQTTLVPGLTGQPADVVLDAAGNMYLALEDADSIEVIPYQNGTYDLGQAYTVAGGLNTPDAVALDARGNIFFCDTYNGLVYMLGTVEPPALDFGSVGVSHLSLPQSVQVLSQGNKPLSISSVLFDSLFPNQASSCTATLQPGESCSIRTSFAPIALGPFHGAAILTDNAVNQPTSAEAIAESGTGILGAQQITFAPVGPLAYGVAPVVLQVTAGASGNPVQLQVSGPATLNGTTLTITGAGTVSVVANQAGNALFTAAPTATLTLVVAKATPAYTWHLPATAFSYGPNFSAILDASSPVPGTWIYKFGGAPITANLVPPVGTREVEAYFTPTDTADYNGLALAQDISVQPAVVTVTAANLIMPQGGSVPALTYTISPLQNGEPASLIQGAPVLSTTASSSLPGYYPILVSVVNMSASNYIFQGVNGTLGVQGSSPMAQAITFPPLANLTWSGVAATVALAATASSGLPVSYSASGPATLSGSTLTVTGVGLITVTATQAGTSIFLPAPPVQQSFTSAFAYSATSSLERRLHLDHLHAGDTLWLHASFNLHAVHEGTTLAFLNGTLQWGHGANAHSLPLPNSLITFSSAVHQPAVHFDAASNTWQIQLPLPQLREDHGHSHGDHGGDGFAWAWSGRYFLSGIALPLPTTLPGGAGVTWSGTFSSNQPDLLLGWQWQVSAYSRWTGDDNALGLDDHGIPASIRRYFDREASTPAGWPWAVVCFQPGCSANGNHVPSIYHQAWAAGDALGQWIANWNLAGFTWH